MNNNIIVLDGDLESIKEDCTFAKIKGDMVVLKQFEFTSQKTSTIYLTRGEILRLASELTESN